MDPRRLTSDDNHLLNTLQLELIVQKILLKLFSTVSRFPMCVLAQIVLGAQVVLIFCGHRELRRFFHILKKEMDKAFPRKSKQ